MASGLVPRRPAACCEIKLLGGKTLDLMVKQNGAALHTRKDTPQKLNRAGRRQRWNINLGTWPAQSSNHSFEDLEFLRAEKTSLAGALRYCGGHGRGRGDLFLRVPYRDQPSMAENVQQVQPRIDVVQRERFQARAQKAANSGTSMRPKK